jgi:hypothetical protein
MPKGTAAAAAAWLFKGQQQQLFCSSLVLHNHEPMQQAPVPSDAKDWQLKLPAVAQS